MIFVHFEQSQRTCCVPVRRCTFYMIVFCEEGLSQNQSFDKAIGECGWVFESQQIDFINLPF